MECQFPTITFTFPECATRGTPLGTYMTHKRTVTKHNAAQCCIVIYYGGIYPHWSSHPESLTVALV